MYYYCLFRHPSVPPDMHEIRTSVRQLNRVLAKMTSLVSIGFLIQVTFALKMSQGERERETDRDKDRQTSSQRKTVKQYQKDIIDFIEL